MKTEFTIKGARSGWVRGPFKTIEEARIAAASLSRQKNEAVYIHSIQTVSIKTFEETFELGD